MSYLIHATPVHPTLCLQYFNLAVHYIHYCCLYFTVAIGRGPTCLLNSTHSRKNIKTMQCLQLRLSAPGLGPGQAASLAPSPLQRGMRTGGALRYPCAVLVHARAADHKDVQLVLARSHTRRGASYK